MNDEKSSLAPVNAGHEQRPLSVIEYAAKSGATPEQLQTMLELQVRADNHQLELMREKRRMDEEDRKRDALLAYRRDFATFRGKNIIIAKDKHVDRGRAGSFNQAEYHAIAQQISPALAESGFSFRHDQEFGTRTWPTPENPNNVIPWVTVVCFLEHKDGHFESLKLEGPMGDQSANTDVQNMQLTASYLKRQSLLAITGTATGGEDDETRMRNDRGRAGPAQDAEFERIRQEGRDAALAGMKPLTEWWQGLSPAARKLMDPEFGAMRKAAAQVDRGTA
jgi:hypothetical protein